MLAERLTAQLLAGEPARSVGSMVKRLVAVQAQDLRAGRLAIRARTQGLTSSDVDAALNSGEVIVSWVNRGTLHLVLAEDYAWLHALTTPQLATSNQTRLRQEGVSEAQATKGVAVVRKALEGGPSTREELRDLLDVAGVPTARQALVHVLFLATLQGVCHRGPVIGKDHAFVLAPKPVKVDRDKALTTLASRYLKGHAQATDRDLAKWAGITLTDARRALSGVKVPTYGTAEVPARKLLGGFDEVLMGWEDRDFVLDGMQGVITMNGIFKPIALVDGICRATWTLQKGRAAVGLEGFEDEIADVERFLFG